MILGRRTWRLLERLWGLRGQGKRRCRDDDEVQVLVLVLVSGRGEGRSILKSWIVGVLANCIFYCTKF
jgi:hypothetical protein